MLYIRTKCDRCGKIFESKNQKWENEEVSVKMYDEKADDDPILDICDDCKAE